MEGRIHLAPTSTPHPCAPTIKTSAKEVDRNGVDKNTAANQNIGNVGRKESLLGGASAGIG